MTRVTRSWTDGPLLAEPVRFLMCYWWVNQNQTYRHEVPGGYLWSPKRKSNGGVNPFYESMREVAPGNIVLSFAVPGSLPSGLQGHIVTNAPNRARFTELKNRVRPVDHIDILRPRLPAKYSPLLADGRGSQSVYLAEIPVRLFDALQELIGYEAKHTLSVAESWIDGELADDSAMRDVSAWEDHVRDAIVHDSRLRETERQAVIQARRGQGIFRQRVSVVESRCRITGVSNPEHLRASHCKPWRDSTNDVAYKSPRV